MINIKIRGQKRVVVDREWKNPAPRSTQGAGEKSVHLDKFDRKKKTEAQTMPQRCHLGC